MAALRELAKLNRDHQGSIFEAGIQFIFVYSEDHQILDILGRK